LVYDKQVAQDVSAFQYSARLQGQYIISATVADGHTTEEVVEAIDEALANMKETGVTAEQVEISKLNWEKQFYQNLQTINRKADILNNYNTNMGDPGFVQKDLDRYLAVTPESISQHVEAYLHMDKRVVLHINPPAPTNESDDTATEGK
jgi:zinc protease